MSEKETHAAMIRALYEALNYCPHEDPGPACEPMWGYKSEGNTDDVANDVARERLWKVAQMLRPAAKQYCDFLLLDNFGKTSDRSLPGEFDSLMGLLSTPTHIAGEM